MPLPATPVLYRCPCVLWQDCLAAFMAVEHLPASEGYHCAHCQQCQAVTKQLQLAKLPPVLILHLKRFSAATGFVSSSSLLSKASLCWHASKQCKVLTALKKPQSVATAISEHQVTMTERETAFPQTK